MIYLGVIQSVKKCQKLSWYTNLDVKIIFVTSSINFVQTSVLTWVFL